jgi:predicted nuclease of predicted toxin-antitoxin system
VRFLVEVNLSPRLCGFLTAEGDTAQHVHEVPGSGASDHEVMQHAIDRGAVIITADTDFGHCCWRVGGRGRRSFSCESFYPCRREQGRLLAANLDQVREVLITGGIVVFSLDDIRVRALPLAPHS